jgi:hypothetical protein
MPAFDVYFYLIYKPRPPLTGSSGPSGTDTPVEEVPEFRDFITRYTGILRDLFERSIPHTPNYQAPPAAGSPAAASYDPWVVNVRRIPDASPGAPDFSGLTIGARDPIVYLCRRTHGSGSAASRRASYAMFEAFEQGNFQGIPATEISSRRSGMAAHGDTGGMALIPWLDAGYTETFRFGPMVPEVFANLSPMSAPIIFAQMSLGQLRGRWAEIMSNWLAKASFHEIAHCKAQSHNRQAPTSPSGSATTPWYTTLSGSIHDESNVQMLSATVAWDTTARPEDLQTMGHHMLFPGPFYKLDQVISGNVGGTQVTQCTNQGTPHHLTAAPPPAPPPPDPLAIDSLDDL